MSPRLTSIAVMTGGALWAALGAMQVTDLEWTQTGVETPAQHVAMALLAAALLLTAPGYLALRSLGTGRLTRGGTVAAAGMAGIAFAATTSNILGEDPNWFPAVAGPANLAWFAGSIALAVALRRAGRVAPAVALLLPVVYIASMPLGSWGGTIITGSFWLAVGWLMSAGALERRPVAATA